MEPLLPTVNACLNASAALLLMAGFAFIRRGQVAAHRVCMLAALAASLLFLVSYLYYHSLVGSVPFPGRGTARLVYLAILVSHSVLAAAVPFLAGASLYLALSGRFPRHRALSRWTLPIWLYVSVTGVVVYWMLYRMAW